MSNKALTMVVILAAMVLMTIPVLAADQSTRMVMTYPEIPTAYTPGGVPVIHYPMIYGYYGNWRPVITRDDWMFYHKCGFSWQEVAMAANIASMTGEDPSYLLRAITVQGDTWQELCYKRGLSYNQVSDVSKWPFMKTDAEMEQWRREYKEMHKDSKMMTPGY